MEKLGNKRLLKSTSYLRINYNYLTSNLNEYIEWSNVTTSPAAPSLLVLQGMLNVKL